MKYRVYTIESGGATNEVAIPEDRVANFDSILKELPEGYEIEEILNRFEAVLVG